MTLMVAAMKAKVGNPLRKLILIKLADNSNDKGECWPSYQHIADQCETSRRSVITHIKKLQNDGFLQIEIRPKEKGQNHSNLYHLSITGGEGVSPPVVKEIHPPSEGGSPGGSEGAAPRTSNSFESVIEPIKEKWILPGWINKQAWKEWDEWRSKVKSQCWNDIAREKAANKLEGFTHEEQQSAIDKSIQSGWSGIFPKKQGEKNEANIRNGSSKNKRSNCTNLLVSYKERIQAGG